MKTLILFLTCATFTGCTIHARPFGPSVVVDPAVEIKIRPDGKRLKCRTSMERDCHRNRFNHRICRMARVRKCQ